jgi:non-canonical purine NTP pyrophosphatase (RdgB/HAM1 family)
MNSFTFITGNFNKAKQLSLWLSYPIDHEKLDLVEIQTTNIEELVTHKALSAYALLKKPVLVEDSSLIFHAFGKLPGTFVKFFEKEVGLERLCKMLDPFADRSATASVMYGATVDGVTVDLFLGETSGTISDEPRGSDSFGWNPIFIPEGSNMTYAEMTLEEIKPFSHRAKAIEKLKVYFDKQI